MAERSPRAFTVTIGNLQERDPFRADHRMVFAHLRAAPRQVLPLGKAGPSDAKLAL